MAQPTIIAIGASSGGLAALFSFFDHTLPDGISYVITTHLDPRHRSELTRLIQKHCMLNVYEVTDGMAVRSNTVYVMPENKTMTLLDGRLILEDRDLTIRVNWAIDLFFMSLASDRQFKKIAVILSGLGSDGTKGVQAMAEQGAYILVQKPVSAKERSMPDSVIRSGYAHQVLECSAMPQAIIDYMASDS